MTFAAVVVLGYVLGSCPWGYWLVRVFRGEDIRRRGSGNIGITNVWRTYGKSLGIPVVLLDFGKGFGPALLGVLAVSRLAGIAAGAAAMVGHWRPIFLGFQKGGKMVATAGGAFFAVAPLVALTALFLWLTVFFLFGYASGASLLTALFMPIGSVLYGYGAAVAAFGVAAFVGVAILHRSNLRRLWARTEPRSRVALIPRLRLQRY